MPIIIPKRIAIGIFFNKTTIEFRISKVDALLLILVD